MESVRTAVHNVSEAVFPGINVSYKIKHFPSHTDRVMSSLLLQMCLHFNVYYTPFWFLIHIITLYKKYAQLTQLYKILMITVLLVFVLVEIPRLYSGHIGNLAEKVPELAGFWLLTLFLQFPLHCLLLFHGGHVILATERAVDIVMMGFIALETVTGYLALKIIVHHQSQKFHQNIRFECTSPLEKDFEIAT